MTAPVRVKDAILKRGEKNGRSVWSWSTAWMTTRQLADRLVRYVAMTAVESELAAGSPQQAIQPPLDAPRPRHRSDVGDSAPRTIGMQFGTIADAGRRRAAKQPSRVSASPSRLPMPPHAPIDEQRASARSARARACQQLAHAAACRHAQGCLHAGPEHPGARSTQAHAACRRTQLALQHDAASPAPRPSPSPPPPPLAALRCARGLFLTKCIDMQRMPAFRNIAETTV